MEIGKGPKLFNIHIDLGSTGAYLYCHITEYGGVSRHREYRGGGRAHSNKRKGTHDNQLIFYNPINAEKHKTYRWILANSLGVKFWQWYVIVIKKMCVFPFRNQREESTAPTRTKWKLSNVAKVSLFPMSMYVQETSASVSVVCKWWWLCTAETRWKCVSPLPIQWTLWPGLFSFHYWELNCLSSVLKEARRKRTIRLLELCQVNPQ